MTRKDTRREEFLREAAQLYDGLVRGAGPASGKTFDDIEEQAETQGRKLTRKLLAHRLAAEEQAGPITIPCPKCGRTMRRPNEPAQRHLDTFSGPVRYQRRHAICDHCGFSFSPAGPPARHPEPRPVEPPGPQDL
jgi:hypothetical protein